MNRISRSTQSAEKANGQPTSHRAGSIRSASPPRTGRENEVKLFASSISKIENLPTHTQQLCLQNNLITKIENLQTLKTLKYLRLDGNLITKIENLDLNTQLEYLDLSNNRISKIEGLGSLVNLEQLNLNHNKITKIENLVSCKNLNELQFANNLLSDATGLKYLNRLSVLRLDGNQFVSLDGFEHSQSITSLYVSNNKITTINNVSLLFPNLEILDISCNMLQSGSELQHLGNLEHLWGLYIQDNPICNTVDVQSVLSHKINLEIFNGEDVPPSSSPQDNKTDINTPKKDKTLQKPSIPPLPTPSPSSGSPLPSPLSPFLSPLPSPPSMQAKQSTTQSPGPQQVKAESNIEDLLMNMQQDVQEQQQKFYSTLASLKKHDIGSPARASGAPKSPHTKMVQKSGSTGNVVTPTKPLERTPKTPKHTDTENQTPPSDNSKSKSSSIPISPPTQHTPHNTPPIPQPDTRPITTTSPLSNSNTPRFRPPSPMLAKQPMRGSDLVMVPDHKAYNKFRIPHHMKPQVQEEKKQPTYLTLKPLRAKGTESTP